ncbi:MAG TPA: hypothetical protein VIM56_01000 [Rhizomicrobium sp.]
MQKVGGFLREQVEICHTLTRAMENTFARETNRSAQEATLKLMMKLIGATAVAAGAMNKLKGTQINQTITIRRMEREGASPPNAKTNGGSPA